MELQHLPQWVQEIDTTLTKDGVLIKERNNFIENELKCRKSNNFSMFSI